MPCPPTLQMVASVGDMMIDETVAWSNNNGSTAVQDAVYEKTTSIEE